MDAGASDARPLATSPATRKTKDDGQRTTDNGPLTTRLKPLPPAFRPDPAAAVWGTACGLFAAVIYTAANSCLRAVSDCDPIWVSAVKAVPTVALLSPWLLVQYARGEQIVSSWRVLGLLALAGLVGQVGGNIFFQWSLGIVGIALAVPLSLGTNLVGSAILGRMFLGEPLTLRIVVSIGALLAAISALSLGAGEAYRSVVPAPASLAPASHAWIMAAGVGAAAMSGLAFSVLGVVLRYGVSGRASLPATLVTVGLMGVVALGTLTGWRIGWEGMEQTATDDLAVMLLAGICNAVAFLALTRALQLTTVVYVNALNATQATLAAVAGVVFFREALSPELGVGVALTIVGLLLIRRQRDRQECDISTPSSDRRVQ